MVLLSFLRKLIAGNIAKNTYYGDEV